MKIALVGYGKMGQAIEEIAVQRGHEIIIKISSSNQYDLNEDSLKHVDIAIEFTRPNSAEQNVLHCLNAGVPVVCGTTGWADGLPNAKEMSQQKQVGFLHASNFSIGVNIFFEVNKLLASLMDEQPTYEVTIEETHHTQKKDAPSGTAITLAEQIIQQIDRKKNWTKDESNDGSTINIVADRIANVPGTHSVKYSSSIDDIEIIHTAHNRKGFALGAVLAAEYLVGKSGVFTMKDVLGIK